MEKIYNSYEKVLSLKNYLLRIPARPLYGFTFGNVVHILNLLEELIEYHYWHEEATIRGSQEKCNKMKEEKKDNKNLVVEQLKKYEIIFENLLGDQNFEELMEKVLNVDEIER